MGPPRIYTRMTDSAIPPRRPPKRTPGASQEHRAPHERLESTQERPESAQGPESSRERSPFRPQGKKQQRETSVLCPPGRSLERPRATILEKKGPFSTPGQKTPRKTVLFVHLGTLVFLLPMIGPRFPRENANGDAKGPPEDPPGDTLPRTPQGHSAYAF